MSRGIRGVAFHSLALSSRHCASDLAPSASHAQAPCHVYMPLPHHHHHPTFPFSSFVTLSCTLSHLLALIPRLFNICLTQYYDFCFHTYIDTITRRLELVWLSFESGVCIYIGQADVRVKNIEPK
jgi:hypothetical protein